MKMIDIRKPTTLPKVGVFNDSLEEAVKKFREKLEPITLGLGNTIKYAIFKEAEEPYLIIVCQQKDKLINPSGYNVSMNITSYLDKRNEEVYEQFRKDTGIELDIDVPDHFKAGCTSWNLSFTVFERHPKMAMETLKGLG